MTGTQVISNQGGCTVWCEDCHESHNCENWSRERVLRWMDEHPKKCPDVRRHKISEGLDRLRGAGVPDQLLAGIREFAAGLK